MYSIAAIAAICHEANRSYCGALGDFTQKEWQYAPQWQRDSAVKGVEFVIANPDAPPSANHVAWLKHKEAEGWQYAPIKDADAKLHPCMVPYEKLPIWQQRKDKLFRAIVLSLI